MTERRADEPMVAGHDEPVHGPFGGYTVETETMPDGRRIRYYSWPPERPAEGDPGERREEAPGS